MKLFKKLMAGAMAIAMLSVYTVAFASESVTSGGDATVSGAGSYAGSASPVFLMKLPTAAANSSLAFTVDPQEIIKNSPPANAIGAVDGTVIFSTTSGSGVIYKNESAPLTVTSMSSVDVKVNMLATLSDTKMKLFNGATFSTASGFAADNTTDYLYLGVNVTTKSGASDVTETKTISALGAKEATTLKSVPGNFKTTVSGGSITTTVSGGNATALTDWNSVEYTVTGASNPKADWQIEGIAAPNLTIKWVVTSANEITYALDDPTATDTYTAMLDKNDYKSGETVTVFVKPTSATAKLKSVTFKYISVSAKDGVSMDKESTVKATLVGTDNAGTITPTVVNGVYSATFELPSNMAKSSSPAGTITTYADPTFDIVLA